MNFRIFENPCGEIFRMWKNPAGIVKNPAGKYFPHGDLQILVGILTFVVGYFLGHYRF